MLAGFTEKYTLDFGMKFHVAAGRSETFLAKLFKQVLTAGMTRHVPHNTTKFSVRKARAIGVLMPCSLHSFCFFLSVYEAKVVNKLAAYSISEWPLSTFCDPVTDMPGASNTDSFIIA